MCITKFVTFVAFVLKKKIQNQWPEIWDVHNYIFVYSVALLNKQDALRSVCLLGLTVEWSCEMEPHHCTKAFLSSESFLASELYY